MPKQPTFPGLRDAMNKKQTQRELFLAEMDAVVPWRRLMSLIAPHYPKVRSGSVCLNRFRAFLRWFSALIMLRPERATAG